jgi:type IV secretion system protein TrbC
MKRMKAILRVEAKLKRAATVVKNSLRVIPLSWPLTILVVGIATGPLLAQGNSPWENAVDQLRTSFTGPIARGLSLVSIVVGGLMFAFDEGGSKKMLAGIIFGVGMAIGAVNFMAWLFP